MLAYSIKDAAKELGICPRLVRELIKQQKIRTIEVTSAGCKRGRIIIPHTELERLLAPPAPSASERGEIAMVS